MVNYEEEIADITRIWDLWNNGNVQIVLDENARADLFDGIFSVAQALGLTYDSVISAILGAVNHGG